jgi:DNA (cytosine-5)-methyltransferase 1
LTHLSLFSGIGGLDLAASWAGFQTIALVEQNEFCQKVLAKNFPGVPIYNDVRTFDGQAMAYAIGKRGCGGNAGGQDAEDAREPSRRSQAVHLLSGGFPCQPFSVAGKREGTGDSRFLWGEMLRVIREVQPVWVLGENVRGLLSIDGGRTFGTIVRELAEVGYRVGWGVYGACHVAAPHRRERVFIVANAIGRGRGEKGIGRGLDEVRGGRSHSELPTQEPVADVAYAYDARGRASRGGDRQERPAAYQGRDGQPQPELSGYGRRQFESRLGGVADGSAPRLDGTWEPEPDIPRVCTGVADRVDRLRALGNAVVPQQVYPILKAIAEVSR